MPHWKHKIYLSDVWKNEDLTFEQQRDAIVQRLRDSSWYRKRDTTGFDDLGEFVQDLSEVTDFDSFNEVWYAIYEEADYGHACWIDLYSPVPNEVKA
jgi:hypothetical protein